MASPFDKEDSSSETFSVPSPVGHWRRVPLKQTSSVTAVINSLLPWSYQLCAVKCLWDNVGCQSRETRTRTQGSRALEMSRGGGGGYEN